jgi:hypothetical protein
MISDFFPPISASLGWAGPFRVKLPATRRLSTCHSESDSPVQAQWAHIRRFDAKSELAATKEKLRSPATRLTAGTGSESESARARTRTRHVTVTFRAETHRGGCDRDRDGRRTWNTEFCGSDAVLSCKSFFLSLSLSFDCRLQSYICLSQIFFSSNFNIHRR